MQSGSVYGEISLFSLYLLSDALFASCAIYLSYGQQNAIQRKICANLSGMVPCGEGYMREGMTEGLKFSF